jgi:PAS domain S-box-containing protein
VPTYTPPWLATMEAVLQTLNEGVLIVDERGLILFANEVAEEMIGVPADELFGQSPRDFYCGADLEFLEQQIARGRSAGRHRYEFYIPQAGGRNIPVIMTSRAAPAPDGAWLAVVTFADISEQKETQRQLKRANRQLEQRQKEIETELALASRVQQSLVPQGLRWGKVTVEAAYHPARTIGGDFGLVIPRDECHLDVLVCDVSGHGIGSALMANRIYTETVVLLERKQDLGAMFRQLNSMVVRQLGMSGFFFTMAAARLDRDGRNIRYAGAGHPPGLLVRDGQVRRLEPRSSILGILPQPVPDNAVEELATAPGDRLLLYTDGLSEVFNSAGDMLGYDGLERLAGQHARKPLAEMRQAILDDVARWRDGKPGDDDTSLVLVEVDS